ncbi:YhgE/Pip family protein [Corynebacterium camporealensis]
MRTSWKIYCRDIKRLLRTPQIWIILIGIMITPALYSWVNVSAFWDPYENTDQIRVAVTNQDGGTNSDLTGEIDVGGELVDQLDEAGGLGWQFMNEQDAEHALRSGDVFATILIPPDFSSDFISIFEGEYSQPTIDYAVNEKLNAISPKITDQGASTLDSVISSTFNKQVSEAVATELRDSGTDLSNRIANAAGDSADSFTETADTVAGSRERLNNLQQRIEDYRPAVSQAQSTLDSVNGTIESSQDALRQVEDTTTSVQNLITEFTADASEAYVAGTTALAEGAASANASVNEATGQLQGSLGRVDAATSGAERVAEQSDQAIADLRRVVDNPVLPSEITAPLRQALDDLADRNAQNQEVIGNLSQLQSDSAATLEQLENTAAALADATSNTRENSQQLRDSLNNDAPALTSAVNTLGATAGRLAASLETQKTLLGETRGLLDGVDQQLVDAQGVVSSFQGDLSGIEDGLRTARTDVLAVANSVTDTPLLTTVEDLDPDEVSSFLASPATMESNAIFPVDSYGSGMSSLFTSLTLWIGAFMLMIIFRAEVEPKGIRNITVANAYLGRFLLLATFAIGQALIVSIGNLVIGVENINPLLYVGTTVFIGLCYLSIVYGLVSIFGHVGRVIAVVLAFIQIPGASGLYPIEMTPDFFRAIHPFLPFTYGIGAMRETVGGFYDTHYWGNLGALLFMAAVAFLMGTFLRRGLSNVNMLVNDELAKGKLIINEQVHLVGSRYRVTDILQALQDREGYQENMESRWSSLRGRFPLFMKIAVAVGTVLLLGLGIFAQIRPEEKALAFGLACLVTLITIGVIAFLEYIKQSLANDERLADLSEDELSEHLKQQSSQTNRLADDDTKEMPVQAEGEKS